GLVLQLEGIGLSDRCRAAREGAHKKKLSKHGMTVANPAPFDKQLARLKNGFNRRERRFLTEGNEGNEASGAWASGLGARVEKKNPKMVFKQEETEATELSQIHLLCFLCFLLFKPLR